MGTCIACLEDLKSGASKCPHCEAYQNRWRNWLPVLGTIVAILTFVGSVSAVIFATATDYFEKRFWRDELVIIKYSSSGHLFGQNAGSGDLFIDHVTERSEALNYERNRPIEEIMPKNDPLRPVGKKEQVGGLFVQNVPDEQWKLIKSGNVPEFEPYFFSKGHPQFQMITQHLGESLRTFEAECMVRFRSTRDQTLKEESFQCIGVMLGPVHTNATPRR